MEIENEFYSYFAKMFTTTKPSQDHMDAALAGLKVKISEKMNEELEQSFMEDEIVAALAQMCPTKAPGPDGLWLCFSRNTGN